MRTAGALLGIVLLATACGRTPDPSEVATTARSWARSAATGASLWRDGAVPTGFARHTLQSASDALTAARGDAAQLTGIANASQIVRAIDSARRELPALDSALAHARRDSTMEPIARLNGIAAALSPYASPPASPASAP